MAESTSWLHKDVVGDTDPDTNNMHGRDVVVADETTRGEIETNYAAKGRSIPVGLGVIEQDTGIEYVWNGTEWVTYQRASTTSYAVIDSDGQSIEAAVTKLAVGADSTQFIPNTFLMYSSKKIWQSDDYTTTLMAPSDGWTFTNGRTDVILGYGDVITLSYYGDKTILIDSAQGGRP